MKSTKLRIGEIPKDLEECKGRIALIRRVTRDVLAEVLLFASEMDGSSSQQSVNYGRTSSLPHQNRGLSSISNGTTGGISLVKSVGLVIAGIHPMLGSNPTTMWAM